MEKTKLSFDQMVELIRNNGNQVIDDHSKQPRTLKYVGAYLRNGIIRTVPLIENTIFCINPIYLNEVDGRPHISTSSCGGCVLGEYQPMHVRVIEHLQDSLGTIGEIVEL